MDAKKHVVVISLVLVLLMVRIPPVNASSASTGNSSESKGIVIFKFEFHRIASPYIVCLWVLLATLAKMGFHHSEWISSTFPESCMLILLGIPIGFIIKEVVSTPDIVLSSDLFFFYLLPPIILDAGYFMQSRIFYLNIGTILLYAVFGTIFNTFAVGASLYAIAGVCKIDISLLQALLFGSLISAVDPVAVLAVFEEVRVHEVLYMLVFGESVLNDAASVVLYRTFESLEEGTVDAEQVGLAFASFFVVAFGGIIIGVIFALVTSFITRFMEHVQVMEPAVVFLMAYMSYLSAEIFHFSGIMSILFCGIIMKPYVESNVSRKSHTTIKYFLKLLSSSSEALIFMLLGVALVQKEHNFNIGFVCFTLLFITIYRGIGVVMLTKVANKFGRLTKVKRVEQFIMSYGGLRGAVAFSLAVLIKGENSELRDVIITTTMSVVIFTVFVQGTTIKKLVQLLGVKRTQKREKSMAEILNDRVLGYMAAGIEEIIGVHGHGFWANLLGVINQKYLRRWLEREPDLFLDDDIFYEERRKEFKNALNYANNPSMMLASENDKAKLNELKQNPSKAMQLALKAEEEKGSIIDLNKFNDGGESSSNVCSEAFNQITIANLIPKPHKLVKSQYAKRKYSLDSLGGRDAIEEHRLRLKRDSLAQMKLPTHGHKDHHHHRRKHKFRSGKKPNLDSIPDTTEKENSDIDNTDNVLIKSPFDEQSSSDNEDGGVHFKLKNLNEGAPLVGDDNQSRPTHNAGVGNPTDSSPSDDVKVFIRDP